ncbi:MAG: hypothetical protein ACOX9E_04335 [Lentisphaeria bacterium]
MANHVKSIYDDQWKDGLLNYTGMGMEGDQSLLFEQNKTPAESSTNGVNLHLFGVHVAKQYSLWAESSLPQNHTKSSKTVPIDGHEADLVAEVLDVIGDPLVAPLGLSLPIFTTSATVSASSARRPRFFCLGSVLSYFPAIILRC